jgi:hypothetical protein
VLAVRTAVEALVKQGLEQRKAVFW